MHKFIENGPDTNIELYFHALCCRGLWPFPLLQNDPAMVQNCTYNYNIWISPFSHFFFLDRTWWENTVQTWLWSPIKSVEKMLLLITRACIRVMEERNIQEHLRDGFHSLISVTSHHRMPWRQITVPSHHPSFAYRSNLQFDLQTVFWQMHTFVACWH
jgi:hypothetical protein